MSPMLLDQDSIRPRCKLPYTYADGQTIEIGDTLRYGTQQVVLVDLLADAETADPTEVPSSEQALLVQRDGVFFTLYQQGYNAVLLARANEPQAQPQVADIAQRADQGEANAIYHLARLYSVGDGVSRNEMLAKHLYHLAAQKEHPAAAYSYIWYLSDSVEDVAERFAWLSLSARLGYASAMYYLGEAYEQGLGVAPDPYLAKFWTAHWRSIYPLGRDWEAEFDAKMAQLRLSTPACDASASYDEAHKILGTYQSPSDILHAVELLEMAAAAGYAKAQLHLAELYLQGHIVRYNKDLAQYFLQAAEKSSDPNILCRLGVLYAEDEYGIKDLARATKLWQIAAAQGHAQAQTQLGQFYESGIFFAQDYAKALTLYLQAAEQNQSFALWHLAQMYQEGKGVTPDAQLAFRYAKQAADITGIRSVAITKAKSLVGSMYESGEGVPIDLKLAQKYYLSAGGEGDALGQYKVGLKMEQEGNTQYTHITMDWYRKAAKQHHAEAAYRLAQFFQRGAPVRPSRAQYQHYLELAAQNGHQQAATDLAHLQTNMQPELPEILHEHGELRDLYHELQDYEGTEPWQDVVLAKWDSFLPARRYFLDLRNRPCKDQPWPELYNGESTNLYALSRVSDLLLLRFQTGAFDSYAGLNLALENYCAFFEHLGFSIHTPSQFHPFYCEIVAVEESNSGSIDIVEQVWPAVMLGNLMFVRAGVKVTAPAHLLSAGLADRSCLYWTHWRRNRPTTDQSVG
ncbi:MAG: sel1 repeat family protein, partial [Burkholderiales bacterium]|nr:sel1 repeat family protein [Burkholderiales bacterium]